MKIFAFDWGTKKAFKVYDGVKIKTVPNSIDDLQKFLTDLGDEKAVMLFEFGGGEMFKVMCYRAGHAVFQVPGKWVKEFRDQRGEEKSDEADARLLYELFMEGGGSATSRIENQNPGRTLPSPFYPFQESNAALAELKILFREHEDLKKEMVREKLKRIAFERRFKVARVDDDRVEKILAHKDASISAKERQLDQVKKILEKKVRQFPIWDAYLKGVKGVGPVIAAGLISEIGDKEFASESSLKHYAGMIAKKGNSNFNRYLKMVLYQFATGVIKLKTPGWRALYDDMKIYYQKKHESWSKARVNAYAMKFVETKFLLEFWEKNKAGAL
jgi:hypothetical protein